MARSGVTALSFAVLLAVFDVGFCLRCYQCNSQTDRECLDPFNNAGGRYLVDCSNSDPLTYNRQYLRDVLPSQLIDAGLVANAPRYCTKLVLQTGTVIRTCLDANPVRPSDTCHIIERAAGEFPTAGRQVKHCSVCDREACNGAGSIGASLPIALMALVGSYLFYKQ